MLGALPRRSHERPPQREVPSVPRSSTGTTATTRSSNSRPSAMPSSIHPWPACGDRPVLSPPRAPLSRWPTPSDIPMPSCFPFPPPAAAVGPPDSGTYRVLPPPPPPPWMWDLLFRDDTSSSSSSSSSSRSSPSRSPSPGDHRYRGHSGRRAAARKPPSRPRRRSAAPVDAPADSPPPQRAAVRRAAASASRSRSRSTAATASGTTSRTSASQCSAQPARGKRFETPATPPRPYQQQRQPPPPPHARPSAAMHSSGLVTSPAPATAAAAAASRNPSQARRQQQQPPQHSTSEVASSAAPSSSSRASRVSTSAPARLEAALSGAGADAPSAAAPHDHQEIQREGPQQPHRSLAELNELYENLRQTYEPYARAGAVVHNAAPVLASPSSSPAGPVSQQRGQQPPPGREAAAVAPASFAAPSVVRPAPSAPLKGMSAALQTELLRLESQWRRLEELRLRGATELPPAAVPSSELLTESHILNFVREHKAATLA